MVYKYLDPGRYSHYLQFKTIRKLRSAFSNTYMDSAHGCLEASSMGKGKGKLNLILPNAQHNQFGLVGSQKDA